MIAQQAERGNKIDALLATLGGQTALNTAVALYENGALERYGVELIGADFEAIQRGEDRQRFKDIVAKVGGESALSRVCFTMDEVRETVGALGLPVVVRPSFTMGGLGSGMAHSAEEVDRMAGAGLAASPSANVLIEESIYGWKEFELELMRDGHDNVVVVCSIENVDPMGVHTGDSVTVAPAMTLTDREYPVSYTHLLMALCSSCSDRTPMSPRIPASMPCTAADAPCTVVTQGMLADTAAARIS